MIDLRLLIRRSRKLHDRRSPDSAPLARLDRENPGRSPNRDRCPPSPINVLRRSVPNRPRLRPSDRLFWTWLSRVCPDWRSALVLVKPETVVAWHRKGFRFFWTWKSRHGRAERPSIPKDVRELIRSMNKANPFWGAPRVHGEILKLGIELSQATVPSTWSGVQSYPRKPGARFSHRSRIHLALDKDAPEPRPVHPPEFGTVISLSKVGGLHHRYERRAA
jgi:hypothetical protein